MQQFSQFYKKWDSGVKKWKNIPKLHFFLGNKKTENQTMHECKKRPPHKGPAWGVHI